MMPLLQYPMNWRSTPNTMKRSNCGDILFSLSPRDKNNFNLKLYLLPSSIDTYWRNGEVKCYRDCKVNFVSKDEFSGQINRNKKEKIHAVK